MIAYEGFDYVSGSQLPGWSGGAGFGVNAWVGLNGGTGFGGTSTVTAASETFAGNAANAANATGNAALTPTNNHVGRFLDTTTRGPFGVGGYLDANGNIGADNTTIYLSFTQRSGGSNADGFYELELHRDGLHDGGRIGGIGDDAGGSNVNLRSGGAANQSLGARDLATNLFVVKIQFNAGNDTVSVWRNPIVATETTTPTLTVTNADMSFDGIVFGAFNNGQTVYHDEIRIATSFADAMTGMPSAVTPEPASFTALVGAAAVCLRRRRRRLGVTIACALSITLASTNAAQAQPADPYRPGYHFTPKSGWLNDPNGLIYADGVYHMYFQYTPGTIQPTDAKSWGHATSTDLVRWKEQPIAIPIEGNTSIWSGTAVLDRNNTAGFGANAIVAAYTGAQLGNIGNQDQRLAYSTDGGYTFTKYAGNPVMPAANASTRDPSIFWHTPSNSWVMAVARTGNGSGPAARPAGVEIYRSPDLKSWTYASVSGSAGYECPDLFEIPIQGTNETRWIQMVAVGGGTDYQVGTFDGFKFTREMTVRADHGQDFYAAQQWAELPQGINRNVVTAWMTLQGSDNTPAAPWRGQITFPREITLVRDGTGALKVKQKPVDELNLIKHAIPFAITNDAISATADPLSGSAVQGDQLELIAVIDPGTASKVGFRVRVAQGQETLIGFDRLTQEMFVDRSHSGSVITGSGFASAPLTVLPDGTIKLQILLDTSVEVFGNDGLATITSLIFAEPVSTGVEMFAIGGTARLVSLEAYRIDDAINVPEPATALVAATSASLFGIRRRRL